MRMVKGEQMNRLHAGYFDRVKQTLEVQLPGGPSSVGCRSGVNMAAMFIVMITTM